MVNVDEINSIIESLRNDANQIHEISLLCAKVAEVGDSVAKQQNAVEENNRELETIAATMNSMQEQYSKALNKLSTATDVLEASATELKTEMKRFVNDNSDRLEDFRSKTAAQLSNNESSIRNELAKFQSAESDALHNMSDGINASVTDLKRELKVVKIITILSTVFALAATILALVR